MRYTSVTATIFTLVGLVHGSTRGQGIEERDARITLATTSNELVIGEVFHVLAEVLGQDGQERTEEFQTWYELGDGSPKRNYAPDSYAFYTKPGEYTLTFHAEGPAGESMAAQARMVVRGVVAGIGSFSYERDLVDSETMEHHGMSLFDNTVGFASAGGDPERIHFFCSDDISQGVVTRVRGTFGDPFEDAQEEGGFLPVAIEGNPYLEEGEKSLNAYLDAGPVYRDESGLLIMFSLSGRALVRGGEAVGWWGSVDLVFSSDGGESWVYGGPIIEHPVSYDEWVASPIEQYLHYPNNGTSYCVVDDGGVEYLYCYFSQVEGPLFSEPAGFLRNWIPCGVARARVDEVVRAARNGAVTEVDKDGNAVELWRKWHRGEWSEPGLGGHADTITRCGGAWANLVAYDQKLECYIMIAEAIDEQRSSFYLLTSKDALTWSKEPQLLYEAPNRERTIENPTLVAPDSITDGDFEVWYQETVGGDPPFPLRALGFTLAK